MVRKLRAAKRHAAKISGRKPEKILAGTARHAIYGKNTPAEAIEKLKLRGLKASKEIAKLKDLILFATNFRMPKGSTIESIRATISEKQREKAIATTGSATEQEEQAKLNVRSSKPMRGASKS